MANASALNRRYPTSGSAKGNVMVFLVSSLRKWYAMPAKTRTDAALRNTNLGSAKESSTTGRNVSGKSALVVSKTGASKSTASARIPGSERSQTGGAGAAYEAALPLDIAVTSLPSPNDSNKTERYSG